MYSFYAFLFRMKYINRWGLMKSIQPENIAEHSQHTALIAHALAVIDKRIYKKDVNPERAATIALFHETGEVLTGDLPTPIKYFSEEIKAAYKSVESFSEKKLLSFLPDEIKSDIGEFVQPDKACYEYRLVKCADKIAALVKCIEEVKSLNGEFNSAHKAVKAAVDSMADEFPCVKYFVDNFIGAYYKTLDEL